MKRKIIAGLFALSVVMPLAAHENHDHGANAKEPSKGQAAAENVTVKGEIVDMVCYLDHEGQGAKHADCAKTCIESGLPVGVKAEDGKVYMLVGEHKPINKSLAPLAAKTVTVKGKLVTRDGFTMIENAEVQP